MTWVFWVIEPRRNFDLLTSPSCSIAWPGTLDLNPSSNGITSWLAMFSVGQDLYHINYMGDYWSNDSGLWAQYSYLWVVVVVVLIGWYMWEVSGENLVDDLKTNRSMNKGFLIVSYRLVKKKKSSKIAMKLTQPYTPTSYKQSSDNLTLRQTLLKGYLAIVKIYLVLFMDSLSHCFSHSGTPPLTLRLFCLIIATFFEWRLLCNLSL